MLQPSRSSRCSTLCEPHPSCPGGSLGWEMGLRNCSQLPSLDPGSLPWTVQGTAAHPTQAPCSCCVTPEGPAGIFQELGNAAPSLCLSKVYFGTSEEVVSPAGKGMFGSHHSSFLCFFFFKRSAPKIEPQSPVSITCAIIQLGLFYPMKTPPEPVTEFQLSHLQLSSLLGRFALGEREKELF